MAIPTELARLRKLFLPALLLGIGLAGLVGQPAAAQALVQSASPARDGKAWNQPVSSPEFSSAHRKVWTREEMLNAIPYPLDQKPGKPLEGLGIPFAEGPALIIAPQLPKGGDGEAQKNVPPRGGEVTPLDSSLTVDPSWYGYYPYSTMGKVFFTDNGVGYVCSASVAGNNAVWTAGHCVFNPQTYTWHSNWVFVPGYYDGYAPHGYWYARELWTMTAWTDSYYNNYAYDFAMAVLYPDANGNSAAARFGALGFMANVSYGQYYYAFGYPALYPYNGERIAWCENAPYVYDYSFSPPTSGIGCDLTGGSSGGPWTVYDGASGGFYVNGVNSYKYTNDAYSMYSPYFGDAAISLYNTVIPR
jgi:V8-like Glu-specific endopeptidase